MSPEAQRIAIAETCGWKQEVRRKYAGAKNVSGWGKNTDLHPGDRHRRFILLPCQFPDYLNDLNAMHEAVMLLSISSQKTFCAKLFNVAAPDKSIPIAEVEIKHVCATAAQRAEAFLKTLNKWSEQ